MAYWRLWWWRRRYTLTIYLTRCILFASLSIVVKMHNQSSICTLSLFPSSPKPCLHLLQSTEDWTSANAIFILLVLNMVFPVSGVIRSAIVLLKMHFRSKETLLKRKTLKDCIVHYSWLYDIWLMRLKGSLFSYTESQRILFADQLLFI